MGPVDWRKLRRNRIKLRGTRGCKHHSPCRGTGDRWGSSGASAATGDRDLIDADRGESYVCAASFAGGHRAFGSRHSDVPNPARWRQRSLNRIAPCAGPPRAGRRVTSAITFTKAHRAIIRARVTRTRAQTSGAARPDLQAFGPIGRARPPASDGSGRAPAGSVGKRARVSSQRCDALSQSASWNHHPAEQREPRQSARICRLARNRSPLLV